MMKDNTKIPIELTNIINALDWEVGQTRRIIHRECSEGKDAALAVLRKADGFWFYCFRCREFKGFIGDKRKSPDEVKVMLAQMEKGKRFEAMDILSLPTDFVPMGEERAPIDIVPWPAYKWFWDHQIDGATLEDYGVGWSASYRRVIIPIFEYAAGKDSGLAEKLVGWIGREVYHDNKKDRAEAGIPKYLTKKSSEYERIYFHAPAINSDTYVIVEDALSAIKIRHVMGFNGFALLNTHLPFSLMLKLRKKRVIIWLDGDQTAATMEYLTKMKELNMDCRYVLTTKDPKKYNSIAIQSYIRNRKNETI